MPRSLRRGRSRTTRKWAWCSAGRTRGFATTSTSAPVTTTRRPPRSIPTSRSSPPTAGWGGPAGPLRSSPVPAADPPAPSGESRWRRRPASLVPRSRSSGRRRTPSPAGPPGSGRRSTASPTTKWSRRSTARRVRRGHDRAGGAGTLRAPPRDAGRSERIRVVSRLGRFLEHARIYHFANGGEERYYIGSADWRPAESASAGRSGDARDPTAAQATLDEIRPGRLTEPGGWGLRADGSYARVETAE